MIKLGIDIGGSGIKGAPVQSKTGELVAPRLRIDTPQPATPAAVVETVAKLAEHFEWNDPIGCTFPAVMKHGVALTAANVDKSFIGTDVAGMISERTGCPTTVINDADAAGVAEMKMGAGRPYKDDGLVLMLTFGTGIGSALFMNGRLIPNTELGHLYYKNMEAEKYAAARIRKEENLKWPQWAERVNGFLHHIEFLFSPDLIILGGGISNKPHKFLHLLETKSDLVTAEYKNLSGIIGAALAAKKK